MTEKYVVGGGHGGTGSTPGKRTPDGEYEWNFNDAVADGFIDEIHKYEGVETMRVDDDDSSDGLIDVPLSTRTAKANNWKADLYFSFHQNANTGKWGSWGGTETYYYEGSAEGKEVAKVVQQAMLETLKLRDRGIKRGNHLWVIRKTNMPAVLSEGGFMDSLTDIKALRDLDLMEEAGRNVARKVAALRGLKKKAVKEAAKPSGKVLYRVRKDWKDAKSQKGAFYDLQNAKDLADENLGYEVYDESGKIVYAGRQEKQSEGNYTVKKGDTLWGIAKSFNTTVAAIKSDSGLKSDIIHVGDKLVVKAGSKPAAPKPAPKPVTPSYVGKRVEAKVNLRFYFKPSWSDKDKAGECPAGLGFTIIDKVKVGTAYQYKVKNSKGSIYYITASEKYVTVK